MIHRRVLFIFITLVFISNLSIAERGHWIDPVKDEPMGTHYKTFFSPTIQGEVSYLIYLPPDYDKATGRRYPVVYWLHGGGGNQRTGGNFVERLDGAIRCSAAPAMIAVLVNGVGGSLFCDSFDGKRPVETVIVKDLITHIDATYRTHGTYKMRAIEGFSMGGFGALHLAFKYPHLFGTVTALAHAPIRPDSGWPKVERVWKNGPLAGNVDYFRKNDPFELVEKNADTIRRGMRVRLVVGDADNPNTVARTRELHEKMTGLNLPCELIVVPGIKHSYKNLYEELGDKEFVFYKTVFAGAPSSAGAPTVGKPLTDMTAEDRYRGEDGGLYGGGHNSPPESHLKAALVEAAKIQPLNAQGQPSDEGQVVLMSMGMSNTTLEFREFVKTAMADKQRWRKLVVLDGSRAGQTAADWARRLRKGPRSSPAWSTVFERLKTAGLSPLQVQVVWAKMAEKEPANLGEFPVHARRLQENTKEAIVLLKKYCPNVRIVYVSSRTYGGYTNRPLNPEPYAYESAYAMRWLIQDQLRGEPSMSYQDSRFPLLLWGPYLWANGSTPRADGFAWQRRDYKKGGVHVSDSGAKKVADQLLMFFKTNPTATTWFLEH